MSERPKRYIIPFLDNDNWKTNINCDLCSSIDNLYNDILSNKYTDENKQIELEILDSSLVDGYGILTVYEKNGLDIIPYGIDKIEEIKSYKNYNPDFNNKIHNVIYPLDSYKIDNRINADFPNVIYSRWCKRCGARKPDIYNPLRSESMNLLKITNFKLSIIDNKVNITWRDSESLNWGKSKIFKDGVELISITDKFAYENIPFIDIIDEGTIVKYKIVNYDFLDEQIQETEEKEIYISKEDKIPPGPAKNVKVSQQRKLYYNRSEWLTKDILVVSWDDPDDTDFDGTALRIGEKYFVPANELDGIEAAKEMSFDEYNINIGHTYYIKPFPFDHMKVKDGKNKYVSYKNYNMDSDFAVIDIKQQLDNVYNIGIKQLDSKIYIKWEDKNVNNRLKTLIAYREYNDSPIIDINDIQNNCKTISIEEYKEKNELLIDNLINGKKYSIGIFPISKDELINISYENQVVLLPGYYKDDIDINSYNIKYKGLFNWINIDSNMSLNTKKGTLCFFEVEDIKYGGILTFEYKAYGINANGKLSLYSEPENIELFSTVYDNNDWENIKINISARDYIKFMFIVKEGTKDIDVSIRNIKFKYNPF